MQILHYLIVLILVGGEPIGVKFKDFDTFASDVKLQTQMGWKEFKDIVTNPICIFEVISESTRNFDKGEKFDTYRSIPGFQEYNLVEQSKKLITQYILNSKENWEGFKVFPYC